MHSLQEILNETRINSNLCCAVESGGNICFNEKAKKGKHCPKHTSRYYKFGSFDLPKRQEIKCKFIDCKYKSKITKGYCQIHYLKFVYIPKNVQRNCTIENCKNKRSKSNKICATHITRIKRYGCVEGNGNKVEDNKGCFKKGHLIRNPKPYRKCIVPNCEHDNETNRITKGLCIKHYNRWCKWRDYNIASKKEYEEKLKTN